MFRTLRYSRQFLCRGSGTKECHCMIHIHPVSPMLKAPWHRIKQQKHIPFYTRFIGYTRISDVPLFRFASVFTLLALRKSRREPKRVNGKQNPWLRKSFCAVQKCNQVFTSLQKPTCSFHKQYFTIPKCISILER